MNLTERIDWAIRLGAYLQSEDPEWLQAKQRAYQSNPWFIPAFIDRSTRHLSAHYLNENELKDWTRAYGIPDSTPSPKQIGLVMASNLPLVGFHDWLCVFISGHHALLKLSSQDQVLFEHLRDRLLQWEPRLEPYIQVRERLNAADAYIATGGDNTARYFEYYFGRFPHIIRANRTSAALLTGHETPKDLIGLSDDLYSYFGRGCRNVTQLLVPRGYDFKPLLDAGSSYQHLSEHHKFKNNYEYQLALSILNKEYYMTNGIALFTERSTLYAPIGCVHYRYYDDPAEALRWLDTQQERLQCRVGWQGAPFGVCQRPKLQAYADGVDTLEFLLSLNPSS